MKRTILIGLAYTVIAFVMLWPLSNYAHFASAIHLGDVRLIVWTLAWNNHVLVDGVRSYFDANIFHPAPHTLALSEHLFGISLFTLPIYALTRNPVLAYNVAWFASFPASALAAHALAWRYTRDHLAAFVAGTIYAFAFFKILHGGGHLQIVWSFGLPFAVLLAAWWTDRPRWTTALALTGVAVLQVLSSWYVGVLLVVTLGLFLIARLDVWRYETRRRVLQMLAIVALSAAAIWPFARAYVGGPLESTPDEVRLNAARPLDYVLPPLDTWEGQVFAHAGVRGLHPHYGERAVFLGYAALAAAAVGVVALWRGRGRRAIPTADPVTVPDVPEAMGPRATVAPPVGASPVAASHRAELWGFVALGLIAFACSLGPSASAPAAASGSGLDWTPFGLFSRLPGLGLFRAPARFALLVTLATAVLAACGAAWWHDRRPVRRARLLTAALVAIALSESFLVTSPVGRPQPAPIPPMYRYLAQVPVRAVVSLPAYRDAGRWWLRADYQYYSTAHWHPIVNGYSRVEPPDHFWIMGHMTAFPGPNSAKTMRRLGVDHVVVHADRYPAAEAAAVLDEARVSPDFALVHRIGDTYLFRVQPEAAPGP